jgi:tetratricopeptide (TPR) repeat protein
LRHFQKTIGEEPDSAWVSRNPWILSNMARVYANNGRYNDAIRMIDRAMKIVPRNPRALLAESEVYQMAGRHDARQIFASADSSNEQYPAYRGIVYAQFGKADSAFLWFGRQRQWGIQPMLSLQADRNVDPLRGDPRYLALLRRLGIPSRQ